MTADDGSLDINSGKLTVAGASGNTLIAGTLGVAEATTLSDTLAVSGDVTVNTDKFKVTASDGSLAITTDKFTVAGGSGNTLSKGTLGVEGDVSFGPSTGRTFEVTASDGSLDINSGKLTVAGGSGDTLIAGTLGVTGATTMSSTLGVVGDFDVGAANARTFEVTASDGSLVIATDKFNVAGSTGNTVVGGTFNVKGSTDLDSTLLVNGDANFDGDMAFSKSAASVTHTASSGGLSIVSSTGYVEVEGIRFIGESMGTNGAPDLITFTNGVVNINGTIIHTGTTDHTGDFEVGTDMFQVAATSGNTLIKGTLSVDGASTFGSTLSVTGATTMSSTLGVAGNVKIGPTSGRTFEVTATDGSLAIATDKFKVAGGSGNTQSKGTLEVDGNVKFGPSTGRTFEVTASDGSLSINSGRLTVAGGNGNTLTEGTLGVAGNFVVGPVGGRTFEVTASDGSLAIATDKFKVAGGSGDTLIAGTLGVTGATTMSSTLGVVGDFDIGPVGARTFEVTALDGSLDINSGKLTVAGGSGDTLIAGTLGVTGATTMSSTLVVVDDLDIGPAGARTFEVTAVDGSLDINSGKLTVAGASGNTLIAGTLGVAEATTLSDTLAVSGDVTVNTDKFKVTASDGSLAITTDKFTVAGGSGNTLSKGTLGVEGDVSFGPSTGRTFEVRASDGSLNISSGKLTVAGGSGDTLIAGTLGVTGATTLSDTLAVTGATTVSSTLGVVGDLDVGATNARTFEVTAADGSLAIATDKFKVDGSNGDTLIAGTLGVTAATTLSSTLAVTGDVTVNTNKFKVTAVDGSLAIASNKFNVAGASGNTLIAGTLGVAGATTLSSTVDVTDDFNVNSKFTVTAASGDTAVAGTLGVTGISTFADEVKLANDNALVTHTGSTGMKITSSSGYVDVESVRFTGLSIGKDGDPNTILLANQQVTITGALDVTSNVDIGSGKFVVTASDGSLAIATDKFKVDGASGDTLIAGTLGVTGATTMSSTLGVVGDFDIGPVGGRTFEVTALDGSLDINSGKLTVAGASGNTLIAGTLGVAEATTLSDTLAVSGDVTVNTDKFKVTASDLTSTRASSRWLARAATL